MKYGVYDEKLKLWLRRKPVVKNRRVTSVQWQQKPCYPFLSLTNAEEAMDRFDRKSREGYRIISDSGQIPDIQGKLFEE